MNCPSVEEHEADSAVGHNVERNVPLVLVTGLPDDARAPLALGHRLYERALWAFGRRDDWLPEAHGAFFTALLPEWHAGTGRRRVRDGLSLGMALLVRGGLSERAAARVMGVSPDTIRPRESPPSTEHRERPSVERGESLLAARETLSAADAIGERLLRAGSLWVAEEALPRVFEEGEDQPEPSTSFFNPLVKLLDGEECGADASEQYLALAHDCLRQRWHERSAGQGG